MRRPRKYPVDRLGYATPAGALSRLRDAQGAALARAARCTLRLVGDKSLASRAGGRAGAASPARVAIQAACSHWHNACSMPA